jgi:hypothetical protein
LESVAVLNLGRPAHDCDEQTMCEALPLASSMVAMASITASRSSVMVPPFAVRG